eukprot:jgi/Ulvmu1/5541/UM023_0077.1
MSTMLRPGRRTQRAAREDRMHGVYPLKALSILENICAIHGIRMGRPRPLSQRPAQTAVAARGHTSRCSARSVQHSTHWSALTLMHDHRIGAPPRTPRHCAAWVLF